MPKTPYSIVYKLTNAKSQTRGQTQWGENVTHTTSGNGLMCGPGWLHAYHHPLLAVLLNQAHGNFDAATMQLWKCRGKVGIRKADKLGCTKLTTIKQIALPEVSTNQRIAFAIYVALEVYSESTFQTWAKNWLSGKDRSEDAADAAYAAANAANAYAADAAHAAAYAAYADAAIAAADAAYAAAAIAAATAAYAAYAAYAAAAIAAATDAAYAAAKVAKVAKVAAYAARAADVKLTDKKLLALAKKALKVKEN